MQDLGQSSAPHGTPDRPTIGALIHWPHVIFSLLVFLPPLLVTWSVYPDLPAEIAIHFDAAGNPDGYEDRSIVVWMGLGLLLYMLCYGLLLVMVRRKGPVAPREPTLEFFALVQQRWHLIRRMMGASGTIFAVIFAGVWLTTVCLAVPAYCGLGLYQLMGLMMVPIVALTWMVAADSRRLNLVQADLNAAGSEAGSPHSRDTLVWGLFYRNPGDPRLLIPSALGVGQTLNLSHWAAWLILVPGMASVVASVGFVVWVLLKTLT